MHIFCGLGNPGLKYQHDRHNVGFMAVEAISDAYHFSSWQKKFNAIFAEGKIEGQKILLLKPQNFMNLSGLVVQKILNFYKIETQNLTLIHDDLDLAPQKIKLKTGGGHGGHNGLRSVDSHCGKNYHRLRIGIGHPGHVDAVASYVLSPFSKDEQKKLDSLLKAIASNLPLYLAGENNQFLNKIHLAMASEV